MRIVDIIQILLDRKFLIADLCKELLLLDQLETLDALVEAVGYCLALKKFNRIFL